MCIALGVFVLYLIDNVSERSKRNHASITYSYMSLSVTLFSSLVSSVVGEEAVGFVFPVV